MFFFNRSVYQQTRPFPEDSEGLAGGPLPGGFPPFASPNKKGKQGEVLLG